MWQATEEMKKKLQQIYLEVEGWIESASEKKPKSNYALENKLGDLPQWYLPYPYLSVDQFFLLFETCSGFPLVSTTTSVVCRSACLFFYVLGGLHTHAGCGRFCKQFGFWLRLRVYD
jgi:hypothetical protein